eukprot:6491349-Amphidinium_carterae.3
MAEFVILLARTVVALRDFLSSATFASDGMDVSEEARQMEVAYEYMSASSGKRQHTERTRLASWKWIVALDNQLKFTWHTGLVAFALAGYEWQKLERVSTAPMSTPAPVLSICADQCSSQLSPCYFLQYELGMMLVFVHDVSHRQSNDMLNSIREAGYWPVLKAKALCYNLAYGPWQSAGHWMKVMAAAESFSCSTSAVQDAFLQELLPEIAASRRESHRLLDPDYVREMASLIVRATVEKRSRFQASRWGSYFTCYEEWQDWRLLRAVALQYMAAHLGWKKPEHGVLHPGSSKAAKQKDEEPKQNMQTEAAAGRAEVMRCKKQIQSENSVATLSHNSHFCEANTRAPTHSNLHACLAIETNPWLQRRASAIYELGRSLRLAHGLQSQENRGHASALKYWAEMANGLELDSVKHCVGCLQSSDTLSRLGFLLNTLQIGAPAAVDSGVLAHEVHLEREGLAETFSLCWSYVENRMKGIDADIKYPNAAVYCRLGGLLLHWIGFPGRLAALLHWDESVVGEALQQLRRIRAVWDRAVDASDKHVLLRSLLQESPWNAPYGRSVLQQLSHVDFRSLPSDLRNQLEHVFGIGQTKIVEDLFHALRTDMNRTRI